MLVVSNRWRPWYTVYTFNTLNYLFLQLASPWADGGQKQTEDKQAPPRGHFSDVCVDQFQPSRWNTTHCRKHKLPFYLNKLINAGPYSTVPPLHLSDWKLLRFPALWMPSSLDVCLCWLGFYPGVIVANDEETRHSSFFFFCPVPLSYAPVWKDCQSQGALFWINTAPVLEQLQIVWLILQSAVIRMTLKQKHNCWRYPEKWSEYRKPCIFALHPNHSLGTFGFPVNLYSGWQLNASFCMLHTASSPSIYMTYWIFKHGFFILLYIGY